MKNHVTLALSALTLFAPCAPGQSEGATSAAQEVPADSIDAAVQRLVEREAIAGGVTLVEHDGEIVHFSAHGEAAPGVPMARDAVFRIYSMSKPITAAAALILVERGKLELDAPVARYLPAFADAVVAPDRPAARPMTVKNLLCHTSGLIYGWGMDELSAEYRKAKPLAARDLEEFARRLAPLPLKHDPGAKFTYGVSSDLLGAVIEVAAEKPLDEFLADNVFEPLGMKDTGFHVREDQRARFTANYGGRGQVIDGRTRSRYLRPATFFSGGGGLVSTAGDYLSFCRMLRRGGDPILKKESVAAMTGNQLAETLVPIDMLGARMPGKGFGFGGSVLVKADRPGALGEYQWAGAASTGFFVAPERDLIVVTMTQLMPFSAAHASAVRPLAYELTD